MSNNSVKVSTAESNSLGTSAHETGSESPIAFTGNPFTDLARYGIDLHACTIRYMRGKNENGNTITGRFNISGRETTAGATSYEALILSLAGKHKERRRYIEECHRHKRERKLSSWLSRHPEFTFHDCNVTFM